MRLIYTRHWYVTARRPGLRGPVRVEVNFSDSSCERTAWMQVDAADLTVTEARWQEYRSQDGQPEGAPRDVPGLLGVQAYFDCGKAVGRALPDDPGGQVAELFKEGVKVVIQAEPMFLEDRGFSSLADYQCQLRQKLEGSCYYLLREDSNPQGVQDKLQFHHRGEHLFSRHRSICVYDGGEEFRVLATLSDGWHEMQADISARKDGFEVTRAEGTFVRGPDELCLESSGLLGHIVGQRLSPEGARDLMKACGGGCAHLTDLTREAMRAVHCDWVQRGGGARWPCRGAGVELSSQR